MEVKLDRDHVQSLAAKANLEQTGKPNEKKKCEVRPHSISLPRVLTSAQKRRATTTDKPRDASTPRVATAAESVRALLKHPRYSKRINYDALRSLFEHPAAPGSPLGEQKDINAGLWTMDADKFEGEPDAEGIVAEEGGGGVGVGV